MLIRPPNGARLFPRERGTRGRQRAEWGAQPPPPLQAKLVDNNNSASAPDAHTARFPSERQRGGAESGVFRTNRQPGARGAPTEPLRWACWRVAVARVISFANGSLGG